MPIEIRAGAPVVCLRRDAYERAGFTRSDLDARYSLSSDEFRVEGDLIVVGPLHGDDASALIAACEAAGLEYFDDYFELSGNWPEWLRIFGMHSRPPG
jgi:hypothetical protein